MAEIAVFCLVQNLYPKYGEANEANFLKLDCFKLKNVFGWQPVWNVEYAVEKIIE